MASAELMFWIFFFLIVSHYFLFGLIVVILGRFFKLQHRQEDLYPSISFIVAAYNEEKILGEKIANDLLTTYPKDKLEYIVVCDGSTDGTSQIARSFENQGVKSLFEATRQGKTAALNRAIAVAKNDILIFSDANSMFKTDALKKLTRHFADDSIGGVCGRKTVANNTTRKASLGDRLYWMYESKLKQAESHLGSIPTADGEIFAMRRNLYETVSSQLINDDQVITFNILKKGKRVIYDQEAITEEQASISFKDDFNVKARMVYGAIQTLVLYRDLLNPFTSWFGLQFFFHKMLRYLMWFLLLGIFWSNLLVVEKNLFYPVFLFLQSVFYVLAIVGLLLDRAGLPMGIFYLPYYYCNVNLAAMKGFWFFLTKSNTVEIWKKAKR